MDNSKNPLNSVENLDFINGLRGIAILAVLAAHSYYFVLANSLSKFKFTLSGGILDTGQRGVQLFFMLSAFTLFNSSFKRFEIDKYPIISFYVRRFFRIIPYYWIVCFIWILLEKPSLNNSIASLLFYFGFLPNSSVVPGAWTLFVEETFYIFLPFIFLYINNIKKAAFFALFLLLLSTYNPFYETIFKNLDGNSIFILPLKQWWCFGIGILLFFYYNLIKSNIKKQSVPFIVFLSILTFIFSLKFGYYFQVVSLAILFISSYYPESLWGKITHGKFLGQIGIYCYSIYLTHFLTLKTFEFLKLDFFINRVFINFPLEINVIFAFSLLTIVSYLLSMFTFKFIEKPFINLGKKIIFLINQQYSNRLQFEKQEIN